MGNTHQRDPQTYIATPGLSLSLLTLTTPGPDLCLQSSRISSRPPQHNPGPLLVQRDRARAVEAHRARHVATRGSSLVSSDTNQPGAL